MSRSHLELVDEAHELGEDEFTLDGDELEPTQTIAVQPGLRRQPPPPPPPRRATTPVSPAPVSASRSTPPPVPAAALPRPRDDRKRNSSGVFTLPDVLPPPAADPSPVADDLSARELADSSSEIARLRAQMRARDAYLAELERVVHDYRAHLVAAGLDSLDDVARLIGRARGQAFRIAELESDLRRLSLKLAERAAPIVHHEESPPDDPRRVRGIGRRFAEQLSALGVVSITQIAAWTEEDRVRIASQLRITTARIAREAWVEQASALLATLQAPSS